LPKRRDEEFEDLPGQPFNADKVSAGVYKVTVIHELGYRNEKIGLDPDALLEDVKKWARTIG
jgi:hypothetical protein